MDYRDRLRRLIETKLRQTAEKHERFGHWDEDDLGYVPPAADWKWEPTPNHPNGSFYGLDGWSDNFASIMAAHPTYVDPDDALAGRWMAFLNRSRKVGWKPEFPYPHLAGEIAMYGINPGIGGENHFAADFRLGLELGWGGILKKIRHYRKVHGPEKAAFYAAHEKVVLAVQDWIGRHVEQIRRELEEVRSSKCEVRSKETIGRTSEVEGETEGSSSLRTPNSELRTNLAEMLECNQHLIDNPPRTLREACQWIAWYNMIGRIYGRDGAGCQLDEILRPYYERDLAEGRIDDETAIFYIACLLLNDTHYYQLSGPAPDGRDLTSKVSYLVLEAAHRLGIANNLTVRVHDGMDRQFYLTAVGHLMRDRKGWPRFAGDKGLTEGFMRNGYPAELARQRIAVGCHWFVIPGREYTLNDIVKINMAKVFEVAFYDMIEDPCCGRDARQTHGRDAHATPGLDAHVTAGPSVAELWRRFESHLRRAVAVTARAIDFHLAHQKDNTPELTLNLLCHGTMEKGRDASDGGVEFYNMCVDGSGLATVADAFAALEQRIEREGVLNWEQIAQAIRTDWAGTEGERIRQMMLHSSRYGQDNAWAVKISRAFTALVKEHNTPGGRNMIPGWFSWSATIRMGELVGATPDGRRAKSPISHGANPNNGFRSDGAATAMASAIAAVQTGYGNTCPIQLELSPGFAADEEGIARIASLIKTHFDQGGTLFNINIIDKDKLLAAHQDPAAFPDLIVRVTGFTAYFAVLSPAFRQLVVDRILES